jgi:hypothetical protein
MDSFRSLIDRFGIAGFAKAIGVSYGAAKQMRRRNSVSPEYWPRIIQACRGEVDGVTAELLTRFAAGGRPEDQAHSRGVAESAHAPFEHRSTQKRFITLEEARALKSNPAPKLPVEERERLIREIGEMSEAYKLLPRANTMTDDEILGYDAFGIPTR